MDVPTRWKRTLTVLEGMMAGHVVELDGYRVTARETEQGNPRLVVLARKVSADGAEEETPLGVDWSVETLSGMVGRMSEEEFVGLVGAKVLSA